ncbi:MULTISPECIES: CapA family protein [unclassified Corallococcus]|uniref:CapA family protein n=1 Tax=unclassified Corallococcus TaxID=2685029 RepID=UPI001A8F119E|nr:MULTISPECIES: CapA family protein [unclassified Corallococcus]MBN9688015.1 CapA family protein [Corallococcus sp. NCSPR001]WAS88175.1 CapA family protein [Corallococcus sp. NCRR]
MAWRRWSVAWVAACLVACGPGASTPKQGQEAVTPGDEPSTPVTPPDETPGKEEPPPPQPPPDEEPPPDETAEEPPPPEENPVLTACAPEPAADATVPEAERTARHDYACTGIALEGSLVSTAGTPVADAVMKVGDAQARTNASGHFRFPVLPRHNRLLTVEAEAFRPAVVAVELRRGLTEKRVTLPPVRLSPKEGVRMLFAGDVSLGRRFLDPDDTTPRNQMPKDDPAALIRVSDPLPGTKAVFTHVRPYFQAADFRAVNLETPVTDHPATPHDEKAYAFFTLPGSLPALPWLGVDYVSLGNNHVYDYLAPGLADTLTHVGSTGMAFSGAGQDEDAAFMPARMSLPGANYSLVSLCSITGSAHDQQYVAGPNQGGAADARNLTRASALLSAEKAQGRVPVAVLHTGVEYSVRPSTPTAQRMRDLVDAGAGLVIAHHPHIPQGFARHEGVLMAQSLGNFAFDQDRMETMVGLMAEVEATGTRVDRARAVPVYIEDYRPRPVAGDLADSFLRHLAELSREGGVELVPQPSWGELLPEDRHAAVSERTVDVPVTVDANGRATVDLRPLRQQGESVAVAKLTGADVTGVKLKAGRDVLLHGDFEDHDVDDDANEATRWSVGPNAGYVCQDGPHRGAAALCQRRAASDSRSAAVKLVNRFRPPGFAEGPPNRDLTAVAWLKGQGGGAFSAKVQYLPVESYTLFGEQTLLRHDGGTYDWTLVAEDLRFPADPPKPDLWNAPWALDLTLNTAPPKSGQGVTAVDDLALVAWEKQATGGTLTLQTPHARDFVRVEAPAGTYTLRVTFREHRVP